MKYTSKPFEIDAFQATEEVIRDFGPFPEWVDQSLIRVRAGNTIFDVKTKNGWVAVNFNDYVINGDGELYPCNPKLFVKKYHPSAINEAYQDEENDGGFSFELTPHNHACEEIADMEIMLAQLREIFKKETIDAYRKSKLTRLQQRLEKHKLALATTN